MLQAPVLVLNRSYLPVDVTSVKRAFCMMYRNVARAVDKQYQTFDFESWAQLGEAIRHQETIGIVGRVIPVPRVIILQAYNFLPKRVVRFSRSNILLRDQLTCQYCNRKLPRSQLNLDHVTPRSQGGKTTWENIVASCIPCNRRKGGLRPEQARMHLIRKPFRPERVPFQSLFTGRRFHEAWQPFVNIADFSYWNVELEP